MGTSVKHIEELFFNEEKFKDNNNLEEWLNSVNISSKSKFNDNVWFFDGLDCYGKYLKTIDFNKPTNDKNNLSDYPLLFDTIKKVLFFNKTTLLTRVKQKSLTQIQNFNYFKCLFDWMLNNKIYKFQDFSRNNFNDYKLWVIQNKCPKNNNNLKNYLNIFQYLYLYREYLKDSIKEDFFEGINVSEFSGYKKSLTEKTETIPKEILEKVCNKILPILDDLFINLNNFDDLQKETKIIKEKLYFNTKEIVYKSRILNAICYFILALYSGMRVSEIVSIKKGGYEIDENNVLVINSTLFKLTQNDKGRPEKWGCGLNNENNYALKAIKILERLTNHDCETLFFKLSKNQPTKITVDFINPILQDLMEYCKVDWKISSHQFRKTFAQLIGVTDKTSLLALKEHFKHASLAMTDYYVGTNIELINLINEEKNLEIRQGFDFILKSHNLAGKLGEKISQVNMKFRGNIEERNNYISDILENSDLIVVPHEYGFCIYQPEQAKCKGEDLNIGVNTCSKCKNFIVTEKHKVFWINKVKEYEDFTESIKELNNQKETLDTVNNLIEEAKSIVKKIEKE